MATRHSICSRWFCMTSLGTEVPSTAQTQPGGRGWDSLPDSQCLLGALVPPPHSAITFVLSGQEAPPNGVGKMGSHRMIPNSSK